MPCGGARRPPTLKTLEDWAGAPGIRGQRELRTEIVACLGKNRRLRSNVEGKPWILFLFRSQFLLGDGDQTGLCLDLKKREREGWELLANVNLIRACSRPWGEL